MFSVPTPVIQASTSGTLETYRSRSDSYRSETVNLPESILSDAVLAELATAAEDAEDRGFGRVITGIQKAREGDFAPIPRITAAPQIMAEYLKHEMIDGWVYIHEKDGYFQPYLVTSIRLREDRQDGKFTLEISLTADEPNGKNSRVINNLVFEASDVTKKRPADVLLGKKAYKETPELKADYVARREVFDEIVSNGFANQYRFTGIATSRDYRTGDGKRSNAKVIHDLAPSELAAMRGIGPSELFAETEDSDGVGVIPVRTVIPVFDLKAHSHVTVNTSDLTVYVYDKTLREKIILPDDQRELLDILTSDIETFTADIIEGKSAGNVILSKGKPGVGKTLTAEVYSELIERPLYSIHSGNLGTNAKDIRENLEKVFQRAKRWDAVLLLDEADVFVLERGSNIEQNAIVAEFLRTLEYFDGLMFMTTNRADSIDDAIISRTAAIIDYQTPEQKDARKVWLVQAANNGVSIPDALLDELVVGFGKTKKKPAITPRDIKMLLRLALRVAKKRDVELSVEIFAQCALFRGLHYTAKKVAE